MAEHSSFELASSSKSLAENKALGGRIGSDVSHQGSGRGFDYQNSLRNDHTFLDHDSGFGYREQYPPSPSQYPPSPLRTPKPQPKKGIITRLRDFRNERFRRASSLLKELTSRKSPKKVSLGDSAPKRFFKTLSRPFTLLYKGIKRIFSKALSKIKSKPVKGVKDSAVVDRSVSFAASPNLDRGLGPEESARSLGSSSRFNGEVDKQLHPGYSGDESSRSSGSVSSPSFKAEKDHLKSFDSLHQPAPGKLHFDLDNTEVWNGHFKGAAKDPVQTASSGLGGIKNEIDPDKIAKAREVEETKALKSASPSPIHTTDDQIPHVNLNDISLGGSEAGQEDKLNAQVKTNLDVTPKADPAPATTESNTPDLDSKTHVHDGIKVGETPLNPNPQPDSKAQITQELHSSPVELAHKTKDPALNLNDPAISTVKETLDDKKSTSPVEVLLSKALKEENPPVVKTPPAVDTSEAAKTPEVLENQPAAKNPKGVQTPEVVENLPVEAVKNPHLSKEEVTNAGQARSELSDEISKTRQTSSKGVTKDRKVDSKIDFKAPLEATHDDTNEISKNIETKNPKDINKVDLPIRSTKTLLSEKPSNPSFLAEKFQKAKSWIPSPNWNWLSLERDPQDEEFIEELETISQKSNSLKKS